jgi:hypothetical protein
MRAGRPERALEATRRAITRTVAETTRVLGDDSVWNLLASFYRDATLAEVELGRADAALADARASLDALAKMAHPSTTGTRAEVRRLMGDAFAARGEPVAAEESYREALALQEALERSSPVQALRIGRAARGGA